MMPEGTDMNGNAPKGASPDAPLGALDRGLRWRALVLSLAVLLAGAGLFAALATVPVTGAVIANGELAPAGQRRTVQHREGGIVAEIHVRDGDRVEAGAALLTLRAPDIEAEYRELYETRHALRAQLAHLEAARDDLPAPAPPPDFPDADADPVAAQFWAAEAAALARRRAVHESRREVLMTRADGVESALRGQQDQLRYLERRLENLQVEADSVRELVARKVAPKKRGWEVERSVLDFLAERDAARAQISRLEVERQEVIAALDQAEQEWTEQVQRDLLAAMREAGRIAHRLAARGDAVERLVVRAPVSGFVLDRQVHTIGGSVAAGEPLMQIVPEGEMLVARARVAPTDIDEVVAGAEAQLQLLAFSQRRQHRLTGRVTDVGADRSLDAGDGTAYYMVQIDVGEALASLDGGSRPRAGMPVEAAIVTRPRTLLDYLADPLRAAMRRGMSEG